MVSELLKSVLSVLAIVGAIAAGLVALFVAWWIALALVLGLLVFLALRRLLPRPARAPEAEAIEGEFRTEREDPPRVGGR